VYDILEENKRKNRSVDVYGC